LPPSPQSFYDVINVGSTPNTTIIKYVLIKKLEAIAQSLSAHLYRLRGYWL
jgi:hypothetical protein